MEKIYKKEKKNIRIPVEIEINFNSAKRQKNTESPINYYMRKKVSKLKRIKKIVV